MFEIREIDANALPQRQKSVKHGKKQHSTPPSAERIAEPSSSFSVEALMKELEVSDDYYILGIDEAGRGPVIGPMVYTGAAIQLKEHDALVQCGVADSKQIDESRRNACLTKMRATLKSFVEFTHVISPADIAGNMLGTRGRTLNTLSHETAMKIIVDATLKLCGKLCAVFVDTVGSPEAYFQKLQGRFPHLHVVVRAKADSLFPVVSAASIVAKVSRDREVYHINQRIHCRETGDQPQHDDGKEANGATSVRTEIRSLKGEVEKCPEYVGCGYPSDPRTMAYVRSRVHRFFVHSREDDCIRASWAPVADLANSEDVCIPVLFEEDARRLTEMKQEGRLKRFKYEQTPACTPPGTSGQMKLNFHGPSSRHPLMESLKMKPHFPSIDDLP